MKRKLLALLMAACLSFSLVACADSQSSEEEQSTSTETEVSDAEIENEIITTLQIGENEVLVYYPESQGADAEGLQISCTAPVFLVFGDSAYDEETAAEYARESGLAQLAAENGSSVCFVNPAGDTWSEADTDAYAMVAQAISDSSTDTHENGLTITTDDTTQEETQSITGTQGRIYVYGIDSGADYVASVALKTVEAATSWGGTVNVTPAGVTVSGLTDTSQVELNDIPVVSIGNEDEVNSVLEENCGSLLIEDEANYEAEYESVIGNNRRQAGLLLQVYDWEAEGITEVVETYTVQTTEDNESEYAGTEEHPVTVATYYSEDLDVENGNVPLVLCFHGGGNTALYEAQATEWPLIGKENGFITVSVDLHYPNCTASEIVELIEQLEEEYSIDSTRIYATGFSMGGCKSWELFEQYPEVFAGVAPMDATDEPGIDSYGNSIEDINSDVLVPVFYVGGETSPLPELPFQDEKVIERIKYVFSVNDVVAEYTASFEEADSWSNPIWGIDGDLTYSVTDQETFTDSTLNVMLFASEDGNYYTAFASATNQSHEVYARNSWAAWDFLSQFSRNEDGSITISETTYGLSSDDGNVTDNGYNMQ